jgi:sugar-specific transcriptional regulator TrmB
MDINQVLSDLGLQDREPEVYLALLKTPGAQPASVIATRAGLNRTTAYKILIRLVKKGLVTQTMRHGILCFMAEDPDRHLDRLLDKKRHHLDDVAHNLTAALSDIKKMHKVDLLIPRMRLYEGLEGVKRVYEDTLIEGKTIYAMVDPQNVTDDIRDYLDNDYLPRRVDKEIQAFVITPNNPESLNYRKRDPKSLRETRTIHKNEYPIKVEMNIYGEKTAFFSSKPDELFGVILESSAIASTMKSIFATCWEIAG